MKEPKTLCETCKDVNICGCCSSELIQPEDIDQLNEWGIKAKAVVYACKNYQPQLLASPPTTGNQIKEVFGLLDNLRGYRPPKRKAEAASIIRMLKQYSPSQIISAWQKLKLDKFWQDKELYMMSVESQIGAIQGNGTHQGNTQQPKTESVSDKYHRGKYGRFVQG